MRLFPVRLFEQLNYAYINFISMVTVITFYIIYCDSMVIEARMHAA